MEGPIEDIEIDLGFSKYSAYNSGLAWERASFSCTTYFRHAPSAIGLCHTAYNQALSQLWRCDQEVKSNMSTVVFIIWII